MGVWNSVNAQCTPIISVVKDYIMMLQSPDKLQSLTESWLIIIMPEHRNGNGKWSQQKVYGTTDSTEAIEVLAEEQNSGSKSCFSQ